MERKLRLIQDNLELIVSGKDIFWQNEGERAKNQDYLFRQYNPELKRAWKELKKQEHERKQVNALRATPLR